MTNAHYPSSVVSLPASGIAVRVIVATATILLAACASTGGPRHGEGQQTFGLGDQNYREPTALSERANEVLLRAIGLVGTPYRYGGNTPEAGFDCSGLVGFVFRDAVGLSLPRSTRELIEIDAQDIDRQDLQPGDLVFFNPRGGQVSHLGIYVGEGRFVHAPSSGGTVRLDALDSVYWNKAYAKAKRVL